MIDGEVADTDMVVFTLRIPRSWLKRLQTLASERAISVSDLIRIYLREALYKGHE